MTSGRKFDVALWKVAMLAWCIIPATADAFSWTCAAAPAAVLVVVVVVIRVGVAAVAVVVAGCAQSLEWPLQPHRNFFLQRTISPAAAPAIATIVAIATGTTAATTATDAAAVGTVFGC